MQSPAENAYEKVTSLIKNNPTITTALFYSSCLTSVVPIQLLEQKPTTVIVLLTFLFNNTYCDIVPTREYWNDVNRDT